MINFLATPKGGNFCRHDIVALFIVTDGKGNDWISSLLHRVRIGSEAHPTSYPIGTGGS
jgi:hypothetical protein